METLLDVLLFLAWVSTYLGGLYWVGRYRRTRAVGPLARAEYRADRDVAFRLATLLLGLLLSMLACLARQAVGQLF
jgi:hypothetical protein